MDVLYQTPLGVELSYPTGPSGLKKIRKHSRNCKFQKIWLFTHNATISVILAFCILVPFLINGRNVS